MFTQSRPPHPSLPAPRYPTSPCDRMAATRRAMRWSVEESGVFDFPDLEMKRNGVTQKEPACKYLLNILRQHSVVRGKKVELEKRFQKWGQLSLSLPFLLLSFPSSHSFICSFFISLSLSLSLPSSSLFHSPSSSSLSSPFLPPAPFLPTPLSLPCSVILLPEEHILTCRCHRADRLVVLFAALILPDSFVADVYDSPSRPLELPIRILVAMSNINILV